MGEAENKLTKQILNYLTYRGCVVWRNNVGKTRSNYKTGMSGAPDVIGFTGKGRFIGVEVKTETGKLGNKQMEFMTKMMVRDAIHITARSLDDVIRLYDERVSGD